VGLGQSGGGTFCTICRECDHSATSCALAPLQQQLHPRYPVRDNRNDRPPKRLETLQRICISWNRGSCRKVGCSFRHICATCQLNHRAKDCPDTPATSEYKSGIRQHTGKTSALLIVTGIDVGHLLVFTCFNVSFILFIVIMFVMRQCTYTDIYMQSLVMHLWNNTQSCNCTLVS
jgi:hypothetical protein